ncbi:MAG: epoxyqueuosine reductase QueH [Candidatus Zipacnadales bacterium]
MSSPNQHPTLLLHVCCAPCATACVERLLPEYNVVLYWYNPNITDIDEHERRLVEVRRYAGIAGVRLIEGSYEPDKWQQEVAEFLDEPEGGRRCDCCFRLRLKGAAQVARELGIKQLTTTLTISPHKPLAKIAAAAEIALAGGSEEFVAIDFKKQNGFARSVELAKQHQLYRQDFCGCEPSRREGAKRRARRPSRRRK